MFLLSPTYNANNDGIDDMLLQFSNIRKLEAPENIQLMNLKYWTLQRMTDKSIPFMKKPESLAYRSYDLDDYVLIQKPKPIPEKDVVSSFALRLYFRGYNWITKRSLDATGTPGLVRISVQWQLCSRWLTE